MPTPHPPDPWSPEALTSPAAGPYAPGSPRPGTHTLNPGDILAGRYRIVSRLGKGGMGEVYRADDLTLACSVALKFLPPGLAADPDRVRRLTDEVRLARQVSHPNVCRVHDIAQADGRPFIAMQYIDGEDLASLLRRIGRLSREKAVEIARMVCFGLAAVHAEGIIHRDLKPANVMLDGRGRARLTDFGIAAERGNSADLAGTPGYMAPELLSGRPASARSDIFALGLLMYELFTGRAAVQAASPEELRRFHQSKSLTRPGTHIDDLDPAVESAIMRCLETDPADRPASALAVAASLPGGDPLAAAIAAGETPSPELLASSGREGSLKPGVALSFLVAIIALATLFWPVGALVSPQRYCPLPESPEVLRAKAKEHLRALGVTDPKPHWASGFARNAWTLSAVENSGKTFDEQARLLNELPLAPTSFWYRAGPNPLVPHTRTPSPTQTDPAPVAGDASIMLNPDGSLVSFSLVPPLVLSGETPTAEPPNWNSVFALARLTYAEFEPTTPRCPPRAGGDRTLAWLQRAPGPLGPLRVEAATLRDQVVSFGALYDRSLTQDQAPARARVQKFLLVGLQAVFFVVFFGGIVLAARHIRARRADLRGAGRLALFMLAVRFTANILSRERTIQTIFEDPVMRAIAESVMHTFTFAILYLAAEPFIRRLSPYQLISWSKVVSGRLTDPLVGRHLLYGALAGLGCAHLAALSTLVQHHAGGPASSTTTDAPLYASPHQYLGDTLAQIGNGIGIALVCLVIFSVALALTSRRWMAFTAVGLVSLAVPFSGFHSIAAMLVFALTIPVGLLVMLRLGVVGSVAYFVAIDVASMPYTTDPQHWAFTFPLPTVILVIAIAAYGAWVCSRRVATAM